MSMGTVSYQLPFLMTTQDWYKLRASPLVLGMSLWILKIKCPSLAPFFFGNPTNKTVTGIAHTSEFLIANHLDESL